MATAIVTDSNCGIAVDEAETLNIHIIPMPILINEISFYEGLDISYSELLQHLMDKDQLQLHSLHPLIWKQCGTNY